MSNLTLLPEVFSFQYRIWKCNVQWNLAQSWLTKICKLFHRTSRKQTVQVYYECIMNEQQPNSLGHEDCLEWQRRKTWLQWLMWPSTQHIGKVIRASSYFSTWKVVNLVPEDCSTVMTRDHHDELAAIDLSMIAVALTPSWLVWILTVMPHYIFHHTCFFCFVFENKTLYTIQVLAVWFLLRGGFVLMSVLPMF